jgi:predicted RNase H-like HicB family nuclease
MPQQFTVIIEQDTDGYFVASVPSLPGCYTQSRNLDSLLERIQDAVELCLEINGAPTEALSFVGVHQITVGI